MLINKGKKLSNYKVSVLDVTSDNFPFCLSPFYTLLLFCLDGTLFNAELFSAVVQTMLKITAVFNYNSNCDSWLFELLDSSDTHVFFSPEDLLPGIFVGCVSPLVS